VSAFFIFPSGNNQTHVPDWAGYSIVGVLLLMVLLIVLSGRSTIHGRRR